MRDLVNLKETQEAVQSMSGWCIRNRKFSYKIARCWLKCAKKVKVEQRLTLFYLLNDVVQHSKGKNYEDLLEKFEGILKEIMPYLKEEKISEKVQRCLNIWNERQVFSEKFISDLSAIIKQNRAEQDLIDNFQPQQLCTQIKIMRALEDDTDYKLKTIKESDFNIVEMDEAALRQNLKDRQIGSDFIHDVDEGKLRLEQYIKAVDREITKRRQVIELLTHGAKYYESLLGEANIVANAYNNFGKRVKTIQSKLVSDKLPKLQDESHETKEAILAAADLSPIPSPDYDAPSPESGELELELPDERGQSSTPPSQPSPRRSTTPPQTSRSKSPETDFNSRLDFMRSKVVASVSQNGPEMSGSKSSITITEFLTKLATGENVKEPTAVATSPSAVKLPGILDGPYTAPSAFPQYEQDQDQPWWDPPPVTQWPAPKPDQWAVEATNPNDPAWVESQAEPIPEWQIQLEDDVPDDDDEDVGDDAYTQNLALQRLQQKQVGGDGPTDKKVSSTNNLINLTAGEQMDTNKHSGSLVSVGNSDDMEMSSDEEDRYRYNRRDSHHSQERNGPPSVPHMPMIPPPAVAMIPPIAPPPPMIQSHSYPPPSGDEGPRRLSIQERLQNMSGSEDEPSQFFPIRPPPVPPPASIPLPVGYPERHPPPARPPSFSPRTPGFNHRPPPPSPFQSSEFQRRHSNEFNRNQDSEFQRNPPGGDMQRGGDYQRNRSGEFDREFQRHPNNDFQRHPRPPRQEGPRGNFNSPFRGRPPRGRGGGPRW